jgi:hypothetical protein
VVLHNTHTFFGYIGGYSVADGYNNPTRFMAGDDRSIEIPKAKR